MTIEAFTHARDTVADYATSGFIGASSVMSVDLITEFTTDFASGAGGALGGLIVRYIWKVAKKWREEHKTN